MESTPHAIKRTTANSSPVEVRPADFLSPLAARLVSELNHELEDRYPEEGANHFELDATELVGGRGAFVIAYLDGEPVGCGAVRRINSAECEIKRMYVAPSARGHGIGGKILGELEVVARDLGARRLVLETGTRQPEALAMYTRAGFKQIPLFGEYALTPHPELTVCMAKDL
jgi:GNAT superfamily N-acetyltransferase